MSNKLFDITKIDKENITNYLFAYGVTIIFDVPLKLSNGEEERGIVFSPFDNNLNISQTKKFCITESGIYGGGFYGDVTKTDFGWIADTMKRADEARDFSRRCILLLEKYLKENEMTDSISLTIWTTPVAKGRPRVTMRGGHAQTYTPKKTQEFEKKVQDYFKAAHPNFVPFGKDDKIQVLCNFNFSVPKSYPKKRQRELVDAYYKNYGEDLDNLLKSVLDALNGIAYEDDRIICSIACDKGFVDSSTESYIRLEITKIGDENE